MLAKTSSSQLLLIARRSTKESTLPLDADRRVTSADQVVYVRIEREGCRRITPENQLVEVIRRKLFKLVRFGIAEVSEYRACHCLLIALSGRSQRAKRTMAQRWAQNKSTL